MNGLRRRTRTTYPTLPLPLATWRIGGHRNSGIFPTLFRALAAREAASGEKEKPHDLLFRDAWDDEDIIRRKGNDEPLFAKPRAADFCKSCLSDGSQSADAFCEQSFFTGDLFIFD